MVESDLAENTCSEAEPTTELKQRTIVTNGLHKKLNDTKQVNQVRETKKQKITGI